MSKDLLLEIGMEEVPARFLRSAMLQLKDKVEAWLKDSHVGFQEIKAFATPRRIAVQVKALAEQQADITEEAKGPSRKIALDDNGGWSKAALGFARGQGVDPEQMYFKELNGVEYVYATKNSKGVETAGLLSAGLVPIITGMTFPKNMRWGSSELRFVRPIRWLVALFGSDVIPMEVAGIQSGRKSKGHRFLAGGLEFSDASSYVDQLREVFVYADVEEREALIVKGLESLAREKGWNIPVKDDLLEEVLFLVEYPTVLFGTFNEDFLNIPQEVLVTSMREHQRYFPVLDASGQLLPFFVTVRNGDGRSLDLVAKGNEKVLRARLSDAKFFYEEDQRNSIDSYLERLETIVFHEELGTVGDKVRRIRAISEKLADAVHADTITMEAVKRAAAICKFDLVTGMVYEFPELQGVMGEDYARKAGEREEVAKAIFEHYQPRFSGDDSPASLTGALVSVADKIDTIVGCFSIGIIPTGSQDPYALRRQAAGVVQIILDLGLAVTLSDVFGIALQAHEQAGLLKRSKEEIRRDLYDFFALRIKNVLQEQDIRYDVIDAVMAAGLDHVGSVVRRGKALMEKSAAPEFKAAVESFNRVNNLAAKAEQSEIRPELFAEAVEKELHESWLKVSDAFTRHMHQGAEDEALQELTEMQTPITAFFDKVMVMAEDHKIRSNRLALLLAVSCTLKQFADFNKLVY